MAINTNNFKEELFNLLNARGYSPVPKDDKDQNTSIAEKSKVIEFDFTKNGSSYGNAWITIDDGTLTVYYDTEQSDSPDSPTPGLDYNDSWYGLLEFLTRWAQSRQLNFVPKNKDRLNYDLAKRKNQEMKGKLGESYHAIGKKASYNDAIPEVKIVLQHNRALEEGEARFRNIARIYLENADGERFLAPTIRPGVARVYARHIAEGGVPNDDRWNHIKSICEDYNKMSGFVRATKNKQFNESTQTLVQEGTNYYNNLRETLHKLTGHKGYHAYFESWTPTLTEDEGEDVSELFTSSSMDPRIESAIPILSRLHKPVTEMAEVDTLSIWAEDIINEKLDMDEARQPHPLLKAANKNLVDLSSGEVRRREEANKAAAKREREYTKQSIKPKKPSSDQIWQKVEHAISNYFPDGDPTDYLNPYMQKTGITWDDITKAAKKNGYKDLWDYWNTLAQDIENDAYADWHATGGKNVRQRAPFMEEELEEDLGPEQKRVGQLGPTEKVKNNNIGKLVGASESSEHDELKRLIDIVRFTNNAI